MMKCYFLGIAGAGVSALASILKSEGYEVCGSDEGVFAPISTYLDNLGIEYKTSFDAKNVPNDIDIAIIGTTAKINPQTNPELKEIISRNIPYYTFAEYLGFHTKTRDNLVVAGSFGKSSLTALITHILRHSGRNPGWFVGAIAKDLPQTGFWGKDKEFIMEGDEYVISLADRRSKFELYSPKNILLSSIVHDHINMFPTMEEYESRFGKLIERLQEGGKIYAANQYEPIHRLVENAGKTQDVIWYGLEKNSGFYCENIEIAEITKFDLITPNGEKIKLATTQLGMHNIENIIAACAYCLSENLVSFDQLKAAILAFNGVERRLDKKTETSKIPVFEGFGSSYEKARSAIEAMQLHFAGRKLIVIFEPHTFSWRNRASLNWYETVFKGVNQVLMLPPPTHGAGNHDQLQLDEIIAKCRESGVAIDGYANSDDIIATILNDANDNAAILLLSSGPLDGLPQKLPKVLDEAFA
jgi:UDP-N-acetylmuramate: L-alanyl-gamma-D-glutamyl-meso-diaminopimelate ligase